MNNKDKIKECLKKLEIPLTEANKINLNKLVADLKAMKIKGIDDYVDEIYEILGANYDKRTKKYPVLKEMYEHFLREMRTQDENDTIMRKVKSELYEAIENSCTQGQVQLVDGLQCIQECIYTEKIEKAFIVGYVMSDQINHEEYSICK